MPRVHKNFREGRCSRFTNESKFERTNTYEMAKDAIREGEELRRKLIGHRVLEVPYAIQHEDRELMNAFRL